MEIQARTSYNEGVSTDAGSEILKHLRPSQGRYRLEITSPHVLYLSEEQSDGYLAAMANRDYSGFHSETAIAIERHAAEIIGPSRAVQLIDLGPGFPDKAIPLGRHCRSRGVKLRYCAVDVNARFLDLATKEMAKYSAETQGIRALFEEAAPLIPASPDDHRILMLGLTFMNFAPARILSTLSELVPGGGSLLIAAQLIEGPASIPAIVRQYETDEARWVAFGPLKLLGAREEEVTYHVEFAEHRIEMSFAFRGAPPSPLKNLGLGSGDRVLTAISHRWTGAELRELLKKNLPGRECTHWSEGSTELVRIRA